MLISSCNFLPILTPPQNLHLPRTLPSALLYSLLYTYQSRLRFDSAQNRLTSLSPSLGKNQESPPSNLTLRS